MQVNGPRVPDGRVAARAGWRAGTVTGEVSRVNTTPTPTVTRRPTAGSAPRFTWGRLGTSVARALTFRCPNCGARPVRKSWLKRLPACRACGLRTDRGENDYFIGAYIVNLIAAELLLAIGLVVVLLATWPEPPWTAIQWVGAALLVLAPLVLYPFSEMLWLAMDLAFRPLTEAELQWHREGSVDGRELPHR